MRDLVRSISSCRSRTIFEHKIVAQPGGVVERPEDLGLLKRAVASGWARLPRLPLDTHEDHRCADDPVPTLGYNQKIARLDGVAHALPTARSRLDLLGAKGEINRE
ncbi:hypothetical protein MKK65_11875 [Methylobacterium sp. J-001]|uniref:hypothetical protein n=1 Tax=Methylobacterium sp. J-001 TaxID=2836609 RepID=UPI001FBB9E2A|nr:hypothetical protein [Methylobacterium sp. J-001]MCJ2117249.1 hypothetical protein [Methylobacterium sp. J-001]